MPETHAENSEWILNVDKYQYFMVRPFLVLISFKKVHLNVIITHLAYEQIILMMMMMMLMVIKMVILIVMLMILITFLETNLIRLK